MQSVKHVVLLTGLEFEGGNFKTAHSIDKPKITPYIELSPGLLAQHLFETDPKVRGFIDTNHDYDVLRPLLLATARNILECRNFLVRGFPTCDLPCLFDKDIHEVMYVSTTNDIDDDIFKGLEDSVVNEIDNWEELPLLNLSFDQPV